MDEQVLLRGLVAIAMIFGIVATGFIIWAIFFRPIRAEDDNKPTVQFNDLSEFWFGRSRDLTLATLASEIGKGKRFFACANSAGSVLFVLAYETPAGKQIELHFSDVAGPPDASSSSYKFLGHTMLLEDLPHKPSRRLRKFISESAEIEGDTIAPWAYMITRWVSLSTAFKKLGAHARYYEEFENFVRKDSRLGYMVPLS